MGANNLPSGFDKAAIIAGLHAAMSFGEPNAPDDRATFSLPGPRDTGTAVVDGDGVPFDPSVRVTTTRTNVQVPCAIEYLDKADASERFGIVQAAQLKITLLDPDYQQIKGFDYVVVGGNRYNYRETEPPVGLGSLDVWTVHVVAEDER